MNDGAALLRGAVTGLAILSIGSATYGEGANKSFAAPPAFEHSVIRQSEDYTCGAAALANLLRFQFGLTLAEEAIVRDMLGSRSSDMIRRRGGFTLLDMADFAAARGYAATGERNLELADLTLRLPAIIQVDVTGDTSHFIVVLEKRGGRFAVADPATGGLWLPAEDLARRWSGIAFVLSRI